MSIYIYSFAKYAANSASNSGSSSSAGHKSNSGSNKASFGLDFKGFGFKGSASNKWANAMSHVSNSQHSSHSESNEGSSAASENEFGNSTSNERKSVQKIKFARHSIQRYRVTKTLLKIFGEEAVVKEKEYINTVPTNEPSSLAELKEMAEKEIEYQFKDQNATNTIKQNTFSQCGNYLAA